LRQVQDQAAGALSAREQKLLAWLARIALGTTLLAMIGGCATDTFISQSGPSRSDLVTKAQLRVQSGGPDHDLQYALVPLDKNTISLLGTDELPAYFPDDPTNLRSADGLIGVGDMVSVTVFESGSGGLFLPREGGTRAGNFVTIPTQQVGKDGTIEMPYAGTIRAAGTTPHAISATIQERLANRALEPQVVVSVIDRRAGPVSVLGEVFSATHFSLDPGGARILEAIARAGGPRYPAYESMVTLQRNGAVYKALLSEIARNDRQNVQLRANDVVYVAHEPRYFLAMGAVGPDVSLGPQNRRFTFDDTHITLADAIAKAGGLVDARANATGVFLYRTEPRATLTTLGAIAGTDVQAMIPTVYLLDLRDPAGYFYASRFAMRTEDVLYISNAPATDLSKFLDLILPGPPRLPQCGPCSTDRWRANRAGHA
jgi:polysaccharide export outer membrane protein